MLKALSFSKIISMILMTVIISGCGANNAKQEFTDYTSRKNIEVLDSNGRYQNCRGYGCRIIDDIQLSKSEWYGIKIIFKKKPKDAAQERILLAKAIGKFEEKTGKHNKTSKDIRRTFDEVGDFQQDCVDESTNTTIYLSILERNGLMKFHTTAAPTSRTLFSGAGFWPHQTATIEELSNKQRFAVDSWFHDNGKPAEILAIKKWKSGWRPEDDITKSK